MVHKILVSVNLDEKIEKQILYAAAFLSPGIISVGYEAGKVCFMSNTPLEENKIKADVNVLIERFAKAQTFEAERIFENSKTGSGRGVTEIKKLIKSDMLHETHQGIFLWREPVSLYLQFLDFALVQKFARPFDALEEKFPNVISAKKLIKTNHLSSFPEHLNFVNNIKPDLKTLDNFGENAKTGHLPELIENKILSAPTLIHNPSTCYHCYASRSQQTLNENLAITALASCHRFESANHSQLGRLMEFSLREVIFLGSPDYVRTTREKCLDLIKDIASDWEIGGVLQTENDPFFTSDFEIKADHQRKMKMKYEYRAFLEDDDSEGLAIMSSNLHGLTFSKTFNIMGKNWPVHTGCIGFGLERMLIAIISQHGSEPEFWPDKLRKEWSLWFATHRN